MSISELTQANGKERANITEFTDDQAKAYKRLIEFINAPYNKDDYKRALIGPAGTGKTFLVKSLIKNCNLSYSVIGLAAPTHKACRVLNESINIPNIKINTLQSDLGLRVNFNAEKFDIDNPPFDPRGRIKISDYNLYIVDEASMIPRGLLMFLEKICKANNCKILYIGDASQLPPVNETYSAAFKGVKFFKLTQIVRQGDDNPISHLLNLLRFDIQHKTYTFLEFISKCKSKFNEDNTKGFAVVSDRKFQELIKINFSDETITRNVDFTKIIAYTNNQVSAWNKFVRNIIIKDAEKSIITKNDLIISYTTIVNQFKDCIIKNSEEYILKDVVNYIHPKYEIKGFMVRFTAIHGGESTSPLFIVDHKDKNAINRYFQISQNLITNAKKCSAKTRSTHWKTYYDFKDSCLLLTNIISPTDGRIIFGRDLDYGFSLTSHKSQGSTFDTTFVDVDDIVFDKYGNPYSNIEEMNRRLYVACSRAKNKLYLKYGK